MGKTHRKHGAELENAILNATLKTMENIGYEKMTMDDIAKTAHTNKAAIYRRWDSKYAVTVQAIISSSLRNQIFAGLRAPNTGRLRDDLIELMQLPIKFFTLVSFKNLQDLFRDGLPWISKNLLQNINSQSEPNFFQRFLENILERAYTREEIRNKPQNLNATTKDLPLVLLLLQITARSTYTTETAVQLVDTILLPVYTAN